MWAGDAGLRARERRARCQVDDPRQKRWKLGGFALERIEAALEGDECGLVTVVLVVRWC